MTPDPTLTDEELAEMDGRHISPDDQARLIAALRAKSAEVERLTDAVDDALSNLHYAIDPYKAPEQVDQFVRNALGILSKIADQETSA
jgi:hypothetical protein